jgi:hypothetical protein
MTLNYTLNDIGNTLTQIISIGLPTRQHRGDKQNLQAKWTWYYFKYNNKEDEKIKQRGRDINDVEN